MYDFTSRGYILTMLFAHWMYWGAAALTIPDLFSGKQDRGKVPPVIMGA